MGKRVLFLSILMLITVPALAESAPCNIRREKVISFSEDKPTDKIIVTIRGRTCDTAVERIRIVGSAGQMLFQYLGPPRKHLTKEIKKTQNERGYFTVSDTDKTDFLPISNL